ncbi:MAG TPA: AAA family ATPase [Alphaproteobacteria bacterium]|nr:ATP-dependent Clp protease ATP-binding subunit [Alphaproteobacteria bacterium]HOO49861.1 AAA family ATPase [Alphaproteobacteria bacterium]
MSSDVKSKFKVPDDQLEELIHKYCRDFTDWARMGRFDPITGRDEEIDQVILILLQKGRKNAALLAPAGVGKTALCAGLAQKIIAKEVPEYLQDARILEVDLAAMSAGTMGPAEFQGRFLPLCKGIAERYHDPSYPKVVLFIDEMHQIMPSCEGSAYKGLSEVMKPYLTVGDLHIIGATTLDEFRIYVALDPAMDRRFQKVFLSVPNVEQTIEIMKNLRKGYEKHHKITVSDEAIEFIVNCTDVHMRKRNQPDKSIIMMDASMAHHVKERGTGGELDMESVYYMIGKEAGIHPDALRK